jgi:hypothetical protein
MRAKFEEWGFEKNVVYKVINERDRYYLLAFDDKELKEILKKLKRRLGKWTFYRYVKIRKKTNFVKTIPISALKKLIPIPKRIVKEVFGDKLRAFIEASHRFSKNPIRHMIYMKNTNYEMDFDSNYMYYLIWETDEPYLEKCLILSSYSKRPDYIVKPNKRQLRKLINEMLIELVGDKNAEL